MPRVWPIGCAIAQMCRLVKCALQQHRHALFERQQRSEVPIHPMVWHSSCAPVRMKWVAYGRFITSGSYSASVLPPAAARHAALAPICVGLSRVGKAASSSKWSTVEEQRRLARTYKPAKLEGKGNVGRQEKNGAQFSQLSYHHRRLFRWIVWRKAAVGRAADCLTGMLQLSTVRIIDQWRARLLTHWSVTMTVTIPLKFFSGSLCHMIRALRWQHNFASHDTVTVPEPTTSSSPLTKEQWMVYRWPLIGGHIFQRADCGRQVWVNTTSVH